MKLFEGKTPTERNKLIAAIVLGIMAVFALWFAFGGSIFSSKPTVTVKSSPTPKPSATVRANNDELKLPSQEDMFLEYVNTPVVFNGGYSDSAAVGRNIFSFVEPPPPTPYSPTPTPIFVPPTLPTPKPPEPAPIPVGFVMPQSVYAGGKGFRLEVNGDKFTPEMRIIFNGSEMPTTFVSAQKLIADIPANFISGEGPRQIIVRTPDGKLYSDPINITVQAPPRPQFQYIGMIARKRYNNDTAYFTEPNKTNVNPIGARLNDVVGGRFRLVSISAAETVFEDVSLGFKHKLPLYRPAPGQQGGTGTNPGAGRPNNNGFPDGFGNPQIYPSNPSGTIPTYIQPNPQNHPRQ
nr:hypothetical protein [Pyrinomonadaceae bacterium]